MRGARRSLISRRGGVIIGLALIAVVLLAMPAREFLGQRAAISTMEQQVGERQARVEQLQRDVENWDDPEFVRGQARSRLHYVLPGEVGYIVLEAEGREDEIKSTAVDQSPAKRPWFTNLWRSVQGADS
ncbi:MAG: septum formation initiator family protein [Candidatus Nanopelagicales bacterium]|nr:septum formation initiator family protein [Candidatus Nanopelagicales bacterium]